MTTVYEAAVTNLPIVFDERMRMSNGTTWKVGLRFFWDGMDMQFRELKQNWRTENIIINSKAIYC